METIIDWSARGVTIYGDPRSVYVEDTVIIEAGAVLWQGIALRGATVVRSGAEVQTGAWLVDTEVGPGAVVKPYCVCEGALIGPGAQVGPFAHLRKGADLRRDVKVGNFVEVKNAVLHDGAKASHLTYLGDAEIGAEANIGAGTITCNYDGYQKHRTEIGAGAFIGSNSALVAPVRVGAGALVAAGSVITREVPDDALGVGRSDQRNLDGMARKIRERNQKAKKAAAAP